MGVKKKNSVISLRLRMGCVRERYCQDAAKLST